MISVIIPCYNAAPYILETIESIQNQVAGDLEIIIVDDGSTDNSATLIRNVDDSRIIYVYQANRGVSAARNKGLSLAKGNYVVFFDADDKMAPGFLSKRKEVFDVDDQVGFCCGPVVTFPVVRGTTYGTAKNVAEDLLTYKPEFSSCPSNYLIRSSVLTNNKVIFNERLSSTADRFFLIELASKTKGFLIDEAPLLYRVSPDSMSNKLSQKLILDNEQFYLELKKHDLIPKTVTKDFLFRIWYILGLGFLKTRLYSKGIWYTVAAFLLNPYKFIRLRQA